MEQTTYAHVFIINVVKVKSFSHKADIFVSVKEEPISCLNNFPREIEQIVVTSYKYSHSDFFVQQFRVHRNMLLTNRFDETDLIKPLL